MSIFKDHNKPTRNTVPELHGNGFYFLCGSYCCFLVLSKADFYLFTVSDATRTIRIQKCLYLRHCTRDLPTQSDCDIDRICGVWIVLLSVTKLSNTFTVMFPVFCKSILTFTLCLPLNFKINDLDALIEHTLPSLMMAV